MKKPVPEIWRIQVTAPVEALDAFEEALERHADAVTWFMDDDIGTDDGEFEGTWSLQAYSRTPPDRAAIIADLSLAATVSGADLPELDIAKVPDMDWVAETLRNFPPIDAGRFYVYGSHWEGGPPQGRTGLLVDAGTAFGSGEHATTRGCLLALDGLAKSHRFTRPLDLGCGSGILALAVAKTWPVQVLAADIDPESVRVTRVNGRRNGVPSRIKAVVSNGYRNPAIKRQGPYDLICANILARPLTWLAPQLGRHIAPGGIAVLSGLLTRHERMVINAHRRQGLRLLRRIRIGEWSTLVLQA
ncbi:50S ribosomal protein L11 methyltransferase [Telmatospirillum sp. J64-1]|uniref:50S ribosomal protein L11 methyltransferase n=1 Tax=Telmatospirillum sp. J64-1 TaxID=2502183 RepID=UPI00115C55FA|nr:50S ribosomal protein L11 methyltransferase [Telmatospirillum sp. J64-1]